MKVLQRNKSELRIGRPPERDSPPPTRNTHHTERFKRMDKNSDGQISRDRLDRIGMGTGF